MTEFQSRRELREAERQGLVPRPEQVFDLPTGQIKLPTEGEQNSDVAAPALPGVGEMLTRKRIREMERQGLLDPLTGAVPVAQAPFDEPTQVSLDRTYDEVLAETEEPITASINAIVTPSEPVNAATHAPAAISVSSAPIAPAPVAPTDIFHSMAVDLNSRKPRLGIIVGSIVLVLAAGGTAAYMLGIFK